MNYELRREDGFPHKKLRVRNYELQSEEKTWIPAFAGMTGGRPEASGTYRRENILWGRIKEPHVQQAAHPTLLVETMLGLQKSLAGARTPEEKKVYERQIGVVDGQIDRAVYEMYGLGAEANG